MMHPEAFIAKLTAIQQELVHLLAQLQSSEHDKFAAHLYRSRREYRSDCEHSGKSGKQIERCPISTFRVAESMGFKGDFLPKKFGFSRRCEEQGKQLFASERGLLRIENDRGILLFELLVITGKVV